MLIEVQPDRSQFLLMLDDRVYQEMIKRPEACEAEEIIIGNQRATYEGTDEGTGDVILHVEDGTYKTLSTEEVYNNMNKDYANKDIIDLLEGNYSEADEWAKKTAKNINCALWRLCYMYDYNGTSNVQEPSFRKAQ